MANTDTRNGQTLPLSRRGFMTAALSVAAGIGLGITPAHALDAERERILADCEARRLFHEDNRNDLRLQALQARDRRGAVPNDRRAQRHSRPACTLPPNPAAREGVIRRVQLPDGEKVCALTCDLCELNTATTGFDADMLIWLQDRTIPATLFMGGKWMRSHERRVREVLRDPLFEIGNHAWAHGNFALLSRERMLEEILGTQVQYETLRQRALRDAERSAVGGGPAIPDALRLFRFPYGRCTPEALQVVADLGLEPIQWDVVAETGGNNASLARGRHVAAQVQPGSILLFHANLVPRGSFQLLRYVVTDLERQGWRFVTVSELLAMGEPAREQEGYFEKPGDNAALDGNFGSEGTGRP